MNIVPGLSLQCKNGCYVYLREFVVPPLGF
jgi:hypothetical protein